MNSSCRILPHANTMPIASDTVNPRRQGDDFIVTGSGVRFPRLARPTPGDAAPRERPDSRRAACMPRGQRPLRGPALASFLAAGLLGLTIRAAHADTEPPSDHSTAVPQDADPDAPRYVRPPTPRTRFVWSLGLGYVFQGLYGVPMGGAEMDALLGAESATVTIGADIEAMSGSTHYGLGTTGLNAGPFIEGHFDRLHIGGGVRIGAFNVNRASNSGGLFS